MWFSASILLRSASASRELNDCLWEEQIVLLRALSNEDAEAQATGIGRNAQLRYLAANGELVEWVFDRVERVYEIGQTLEPGTELFSRFLRSSEVESLLKPFDD